MSRSNWQWILDMNPDLRGWKQTPWTRFLKRGEHILWACANPACKDASGARTVFDRGTNLRGSEFCPRCVDALARGDGAALDPALKQAAEECAIDGGWKESKVHRERINPRLASIWLDQFKE